MNSKSIIQKARKQPFQFISPLEEESYENISKHIPKKFIDKISGPNSKIYKTKFCDTQFYILYLSSPLEIHDDLRKEIFLLTKKNMESFNKYWDDNMKFKEIFEEEQNMNYLILFSIGQVKKVYCNKDAEINENGCIFASFSSFLYDIDFKRPVLYLYEIQLKEEFQGLGIGKWIIHQLLHNANKNFLSKLALTVQKKNVKAIQFYERLGFEIDETDPSNFEEEADYFILSMNTK